MGNTKSQTRGLTVARDGKPDDADPFAELADIFETELQFDQRFAEGSTARRSADARPVVRREPEIDFDLSEMEEEFKAVFESDLAASRPVPPTAPRQTAAYQPRIEQKPVPQAPLRRASDSRPTHLTDEEIDHELEAVLRNLSAPARPRDRIVVETQSFAPERAVEERVPHTAPADIDEFEELIRSELAAIRPSLPTRAVNARASEPVMPESFGAEDAYVSDYAHEAAARSRPVAANSNWRRRLAAGASAAAILLVAGAGFAVWRGGAPTLGSGDQPLLIKADAEPYKVAPKDPGGRAYPNQNKAVYDRVASPNKNEDTPMQQALLKNDEEPMDLPAEEEESYPDNLPGVELGDTTAEGAKDETRITEATETADAGSAPVLQPRKVKTMIVGSDGRLVMAETPATAPTPPAPAPVVAAVAAPVLDKAPILRADAVQPEASNDPFGVLQVADPVQVAAVAPPKVEAPAKQKLPGADEAKLAKIEDAKPQPIETAVAMPAGGYFVQVSSQPSEAAAQQSMRSFGGRYGSVVGGKPVGIQSAAIPGKGTYYRVRVAAGSKDEAASICGRLKSAGAACFVTR